MPSVIAAKTTTTGTNAKKKATTTATPKTTTSTTTKVTDSQDKIDGKTTVGTTNYGTTNAVSTTKPTTIQTTDDMVDALVPTKTTKSIVTEPEKIDGKVSSSAAKASSVTSSTTTPTTTTATNKAVTPTTTKVADSQDKIDGKAVSGTTNNVTIKNNTSASNANTLNNSGSGVQQTPTDATAKAAADAAQEKGKKLTDYTKASAAVDKYQADGLKRTTDTKYPRISPILDMSIPNANKYIAGSLAGGGNDAAVNNAVNALTTPQTKANTTNSDEYDKVDGQYVSGESNTGVLGTPTTPKDYSSEKAKLIAANNAAQAQIDGIKRTYAEKEKAAENGKALPLSGVGTYDETTGTYQPTFRWGDTESVAQRAQEKQNNSVFREYDWDNLFWNGSKDSGNSSFIKDFGTWFANAGQYPWGMTQDEYYAYLAGNNSVDAATEQLTSTPGQTNNTTGSAITVPNTTTGASITTPTQNNSAYEQAKAAADAAQERGKTLTKALQNSNSNLSTETPKPVETPTIVPNATTGEQGNVIPTKEDDTVLPNGNNQGGQTGGVNTGTGGTNLSGSGTGNKGNSDNAGSSLADAGKSLLNDMNANEQANTETETNTMSYTDANGNTFTFNEGDTTTYRVNIPGFGTATITPSQFDSLPEGSTILGKVEGYTPTDLNLYKENPDEALAQSSEGTITDDYSNTTNTAYNIAKYESSLPSSANVTTNGIDFSNCTPEEIANTLFSIINNNPTMDSFLSWAEAYAMAYDVLGSSYDAETEEMLNQLRTNALSSGFYGQLPYEQIKANAIASAEVDKMKAIAEYATQLRESDADTALAKFNAEMEAKQITTDDYINMLELYWDYLNSNKEEESTPSYTSASALYSAAQESDDPYTFVTKNYAAFGYSNAAAAIDDLKAYVNDYNASLSSNNNTGTNTSSSKGYDNGQYDSNAVANLQTVLKNKGLYDGAIDGKYGPKTRAAAGGVDIATAMSKYLSSQTTSSFSNSEYQNFKKQVESMIGVGNPELESYVRQYSARMTDDQLSDFYTMLIQNGYTIK